MTRLRWLVVASLSLCAVAPAQAVDIPVAAQKLVVVDTQASNGKAKTVFVAKDPAIAKGSGTDAAEIYSSLDMAFDGSSGLFEMPLGAGWIANSSNGATYVNKTAPFTGVKSSVIKPGSLLKVLGRSLGDSGLDISIPPPGGTVYVAQTIVNDEDETRLCTQFSGCEHKVIAGGTGYKLTCKDGTGDPGCAAATLPPTTTITSVGTGSFTTATFTFESSSPGTFYCRMDADEFVPCASPYIATALTAGSLHTFEVYAADFLSRGGPIAARSWFSPPAEVPPSYSYFALEHTLTLDTISLAALAPHPTYPGPHASNRIAYVQSGAAVSLNLLGSFSYMGGPGYCPGCVTNFYVGISGYDLAMGGTYCLGSGSTGPIPVMAGHVFPAPAAPGVYFINPTANWEFFCTNTYPAPSAGFSAETVAVLVVEP